MAFLPKTQRTRLDFGGRSEEFSNELMLAHEIAHQWWGNQIGWQTYHDQWLSEGFATYSAALQIASEKDGSRKFRELLRQYKADLISKTPQGATVESGGPIFMGHRLSNSQNPDGFTDIIYKKSCWVLHMLRELMTSGPKRKEEPFFAMLRDFVTAFRGRSASTQDFIHYAEKYMTPSMNLERNRRLEWFFDDWVYGTGVPEYKLNVAVKRLGAGKYAITGKIQQAGVPADFEMPVPLVARYGRERSERLGWVLVDERGGEFRFTRAEKPERVAIDEESILAVVK
jgi:aminopeptidase N